MSPLYEVEIEASVTVYVEAVDEKDAAEYAKSVKDEAIRHWDPWITTDVSVIHPEFVEGIYRQYPDEIDVTQARTRQDALEAQRAEQGYEEPVGARESFPGWEAA